eukprot:COSAG06_NODE_3785_length_4904_cov_1.736316_2_plen_74_part_00
MVAQHARKNVRVYYVKKCSVPDLEPAASRQSSPSHAALLTAQGQATLTKELTIAAVGGGTIYSTTKKAIIINK